MRRIIAFLIRNIPRKYLQLFSGFGLKILGIFYAGRAVTCPICERSYRSFLPYGRINPRPNALCPNCLSLERHRLIWLYLGKRSDFLAKPHDVLHIAPEHCFIARFEKLHGNRYITADLESPLAKVKMDIHHMPFSDASFDVVLCNHVLEHVEDDIQALREIARVLRPGGWAVLQVPFFAPVPDKTIEDKSITLPSDREKAFGQDDHVRKYGKDYPERIERGGLTAVADGFAASLDEASAKRYGISRNEILYIGRK